MTDSIFSPIETRTNVLLEDRELHDAVPERDRASAVRASVAAAAFVRAGTWDAKNDAHRTARGFGLLVLEGVLVRRVRFGDRIGGELLGPGDVLRPSEHDGEEATVPFDATWTVLSDLRLALLDRRWSERMAAFPDVSITLTSRALGRARRLANMLTIALHPKLDERLQLLMWELADRYGRVHRDGVHVDLPLTHELISQLAGARRPSVSSALARLVHSGLIERHGTGWILHGDPPASPVTPTTCSVSRPT
jgi:CRP/FNR family transcriptional regulator, cyclic AMP receptor protein